MDDENPYAPPKTVFLDEEILPADPSAAYRDRKMLVARKGAVLPDRCLKCNAPAEGFRFNRSLSWHRPIWFVLLLNGLFLYLVVYFLVRWRGSVTVGLCPHHRQRRMRAIAIGWLLILAGTGIAIAAAAVPSNLAPILVVSGIVVLLGGITSGMLGSQVLVPKRIDKNYIWLSHVSPDYLADLPDWVPR